MTTYYEMNEDFLMHFGVPGMKWGHRKQRINKSTSSLGGLIGTRYGKSSSGGTKQLSKRKQQKIKEKQNYKLVKNRLKEKGIDSMKLQNYEHGGVSRKKVKKYLGKDISVSQVSDYVKHRDKTGMKVAAAAAGVTMAAVLAYNQKGNITRTMRNVGSAMSKGDLSKSEYKMLAKNTAAATAAYKKRKGL